MGLLGILLGEQVVPLAKRLSAGHALTAGLVRDQSACHVLGKLPERKDAASDRSNGERS